MNTYLVTKVCRQCWRVTVIPLNKSAKGTSSVKNGRKGSRHYCITGNLPALYPQMVIGLELDGMKVTDYSVEFSKKNIDILHKHQITEQGYREMLTRHRTLKQDGFTWEDVQVEVNKIYDKFTFSDADKIHKKIVNNPSDNRRLEAINRNIIHTGRQHRKIVYSMNEFFRFFDNVEIQGAYEKLIMPIKARCLQAECYRIKGNMVCDIEMKEKEDFVTQNIFERVREGNHYQLLTTSEIDLFIEEKQNSGLADEQLNVMNCLYSSVPCIVTGGAGTGKTSVIRTLIECYAKYYGKQYILLTAPTGKASRRLAEKTGMPACTIHKALRKSVTDEYVYYNAERKLPHRLIIVDESSMIDTALMYDLLQATDMAAKIIFVGDHNQLNPVGYGEPFFAFMEIMDIYCLHQNHRQSEDTDILEMANRVLYDKPITNGRSVLVQKIDYEEIPLVLDYYLCGNGYVEDSQVISPFNWLNDNINQYVQKRFAEMQEEFQDGDEELSKKFYIGDKIMTLRNTENYCNGDIGTVTAVDPQTITIQINGKQIAVPMKDKSDITLAYAITVHKMQGSEANRVLVFLPCQTISKRMLYTALTRAKNELMIYYY